jgi:hypothetical protein
MVGFDPAIPALYGVAHIMPSYRLVLIPAVQTDDSSAQHPHFVMTGLVPVIPSGTNSLKSFAYLSGTMFGINQHWGYDLPPDNVSNASAGCLVGRTKTGHRAYMQRVKSDARFAVSHSYRFQTTILAAADVRK